MAIAAEDAYKPEFKPVFESKQDAFWVTLWNMNYVQVTATNQVVDPVGDPVSAQVAALLELLEGKELSTYELMAALDLSHRQTFRENYLRPALNDGLIERTVPDKPNSRNQKYRCARR